MCSKVAPTGSALSELFMRLSVYSDLYVAAKRLPTG